MLLCVDAPQQLDLRYVIQHTFTHLKNKNMEKIKRKFIDKHVKQGQCHTKYSKKQSNSVFAHKNKKIYEGSPLDIL